MKNRFLKISFPLSLLAASFCVFTGCPVVAPSSSEVAIFHTDSLHVNFNIPAGETVITDSGVVDLNSVRSAMDSGKIDTSTLVVTDIAISVDPTDTTSARIVAGDAGIPLLVNAYYSTPQSPWTLFMQTPGSGASISGLAAAFILNRDFFGVNPGYSDFKNAVQNPLTSEIGFKFELTPLQIPPATGVLKLNVIISEAAKVRT